MPLQPAIPVLAVFRVETSKSLRQQKDEKHPLAKLTVYAEVEPCSYHQKLISDLSISWGSQVLYLSDLDSLIYTCTRTGSHTYFQPLDIHVTTVCAGSPLQLLYAAFVSFTVTECHDVVSCVKKEGIHLDTTASAYACKISRDLVCLHFISQLAPKRQWFLLLIQCRCG